MSAQHVSEPWRVAEESFDNGGIQESVIRGLDGRAAIAVTLEFGPNNPGMREANARRIVACVNACAGIPTEELEPGEYERHIIETGQEIGRLTAQRDELLSTLKSLMDAAGQWTSNSEALQLAHFQAHVVIAKARGVTK